MKYKVEENDCCCHPESCCCDTYRIVDEENNTFLTVDSPSKATHIAIALSEYNGPAWSPHVL